MRKYLHEHLQEDIAYHMGLLKRAFDNRTCQLKEEFEAVLKVKHLFNDKQQAVCVCVTHALMSLDNLTTPPCVMLCFGFFYVSLSLCVCVCCCCCYNYYVQMKEERVRQLERTLKIAGRFLSFFSFFEALFEEHVSVIIIIIIVSINLVCVCVVFGLPPQKRK